MILDYDALKAADAALDPPIADPAAAAAALNAQTVVSEPIDFSSLDALNILLVTGEWAKIVVRAEERPLTPAVVSAIGATALLQSRGVIRGTQPQAWAAFQASMQAMNAAGDVGDETMAAIFALRTPILPFWPVVLTEYDVAVARAR